MTDDATASEAKEDDFLVPLLLVMTAVTGTVDAVSILRLGHVFVANMTGNVVFLGFAFAGAPGFPITASLVALGDLPGGLGVAARCSAGCHRDLRLLGRGGDGSDPAGDRHRAHRGGEWLGDRTR